MRVLFPVLTSLVLLHPAPVASHAAAAGAAFRSPPLYGAAPAGQAAPALPAIHAVFGAPTTVATHAQLMGYGFAWGPSDGQFGAIRADDGSYTFYGTAGSSSACAGTPNVEAAFTFTGTLDRVTGSNCKRLFGPGDGPAGWLFDRDYAGGGQIVRFASGGQSGWLMPFHGEFWWSNSATSNHTCNGITCFYSSLGLAVSIDDGKSFKVVGQILQPSQPLSVFTSGGTNMPVGYGSLVVADANGQHLDNPPADPSSAYFYLFYSDLLPGLPGACATFDCLGVARAPYAALVASALSGDAHAVATVFHKYDGASPDPWAQPATSDTPGESGTAGTYAPLWTDEVSYQPEVIFDSTFNVYLAVYESGASLSRFQVRASRDLLHWSEPIGVPYSEAGRALYQPTLIGETGDPAIGGPAPRIYFTSWPTGGAFFNWSSSIFESLPLTLSAGP